MGIIRNGIEAGGAIAYDYANVTNIRRDVYKAKVDIVKTPMVQELVRAAFVGDVLPKSIWANRNGLFTKPFDENSNTYHPNGIQVYAPEVTFDYIFATALLHIFMDLYPNVYEMNRVTTTELSQGLQSGTWQSSLELKDEYKGKKLCPAFDIFNIANTPIEALPLVLEDKYTKKSGSLATVALVLGIIAVVFSFVGALGTLFAGVGIIVGAINLLTTEKGKKKSKKAIWGIILSVLSFILPIVIGIIGFMNMFSF